MRLNTKQRESAAKYFYDVSKGFLLVGVVGIASGKIIMVAFVAHLVTAAYAVIGGFWLEKET